MLRSSDLIIHAGDVGAPEILDQLRGLAPTVTVKGNIDKGDWASTLPFTTVVECGPALIYVIHDLAELDLNPAAAGLHVVISGHSHKAAHFQKDGVEYINPGSAGPRQTARYSRKTELALATLES